MSGLRLTEREYYILEAHNLQDPPKSYRILGKELGISQERTRQVGINGLDKLNCEHKHLTLRSRLFLKEYEKICRHYGMFVGTDSCDCDAVFAWRRPSPSPYSVADLESNLRSLKENQYL